jgi:hypothetical protein
VLNRINKNTGLDFEIYLNKKSNEIKNMNRLIISSESLWKIDNLYSDINLRDGGFYTLQNISPNSFQLIKEIKEIK